MRDFHLSCEKDTKLQTLSAEISWSHNIAILENGKDILKKEFYCYGKTVFVTFFNKVRDKKKMLIIPKLYSI